MSTFIIEVSYTETITYSAELEIEAFDQEAAMAHAEAEFQADHIRFKEGDISTTTAPVFSVLSWEE